ncbi:MAG: amino acid ABC transporter permease [Sneathiellaceae bacterium]
MNAAQKDGLPVTGPLTSDASVATVEMAADPGAGRRATKWLRDNLFSGWVNSLLTILALAFLAWVVPPMLNWVLFEAVWSGTPEDCQASDGACWAFIGEKMRLILFGQYPPTEQWRPQLSVLLLLAVIAVSLVRRFWKLWLVGFWILSFVVLGLLMWGGFAGMTFVPNHLWGGLPLTLGLATVGVIGAFPLGLALALGRQSRLPFIRTLSVTYIELIRGVPLITVLFMASVMFPLFLPEGVSIDKLLRAQIGIILFTAAYLAEVFRGGLQAIPKGQYEAAADLGLGYWRAMGLVILPQALRLVIPPTVNSFISMFKDTSLVIIIGLFDLLGTVRLALTDPPWSRFHTEGYVFVGAIFFLFCFAMARYAGYLEKEMGKSDAR